MLRRIRQVLGSLPRRLDNAGNVATVAALAMGPICMATLGAADLARATSAKMQLQDALDAAALAAARTNSATDAQLKAAGDRVLAQNLALGPSFQIAASDFHFAPNNTVVGTATVTVQPFIASMLTGGPLTVGATSEVVRADMTVEIALVLDTTASMNSNNKLSNMKTAATNFITSMEAAAAKSIRVNPVKISIVPFANTVRVDEVAHRYSAWVDQTGSSPINDEIFTTASGTQHANRFNLFSALGTSWRGCLEMRKAPYDVDDTIPTSGATLYTPYFAVDEPDYQTSGYSQNYQNDYINDGTSSTNWRVRQGMISKYAPKSGLTTSFGPNKDCKVDKMTRLSTNFSALKTQINGLVANGNTNIPIGLAWGWNTLSPYAPFADGVAYGTPKHKKILILMTDGDNTMDRRNTPNDGTYAATGYIWQGRIITSSGAALAVGASDAARTAGLDYRTSLLCQNIKTRGIEVYTIKVEAGSSSLLSACASSDDHFFDVTNSANLNEAFQAIAGQIAALHLSK